MAIVLAVDVMGGDHGVAITVPACIEFLRDNPEAKLIMLGDKLSIEEQLDKADLPPCNDSLTIMHTTQVVCSDEVPQSAMRNKKDSSMRIAIDLIKNGQAHAAVSAGNTGALMAISRYVLRTMQGIDRPAIAKILPTIKGEACVLDLGASIEALPENLLQFGIMGAQLMRAVTGKLAPSIGILNVGSEEIKGHDSIKQASELLRNSTLNFYGNVEGDDINKGTVDVVVCDGFTGNVALKTMEGTAKMINHFLKEEFTLSIPNKVMAFTAYPVLQKVKARLDPRKYNGAVLLGLNGLVVKSHGGADEVAFYYALTQAYHEASAGVIGLLEEFLSNNQSKQ